MPNRQERRANKDNPASKVAKDKRINEQLIARSLAREKSDARIKDLEKLGDKITIKERKELKRIKVSK